MTEGASVLVVDDESFLADLVSSALRYAGFRTRTAGSVAAAWDGVRELRPDVMVLDVMLGDDSGFDFCRELRARGIDTPILFLTARDAPGDRIAGFTAGGDDYIPKPFGLEELVLRVTAVARRSRPALPAGLVLEVADLRLDELAHEVRRGGRSIHLTPTEFSLLRLLMRHVGQVLTKRQILEHVWNYDFGGNDGVVQTYVSYLRTKIDRDAEPLIHTIPRIGYVLRIAGER